MTDQEHESATPFVWLHREALAASIIMYTGCGEDQARLVIRDAERSVKTAAQYEVVYPEEAKGWPV